MLILGIPTWDFGEIQEDWLAVWEQLPQLDLSGKIVAMYGMGDQVDYSDWFLDALGYLHQQLQSSRVKFAGYWPVDGYTFTSPKALTRTANTLSAWHLMMSISMTKAKSASPHGVCRYLRKFRNCCRPIRYPGTVKAAD